MKYFMLSINLIAYLKVDFLIIWKKSYYCYHELKIKFWDNIDITT